ncbi:hypothetical protein SNE40_017093 [Patella caerulea]|uniref:GON domain-containing protein n=1 Tax=Patella caerulea TaxID=87958 RepID=A0AAN8PPK4_PATCE
MVFKDFNFILFISNYVIPDQSSMFYTRSRLHCAIITRGRGHQSFFYHRDIRACITLSEKINSAQNLTYGDGFQYWIDSAISSCEDIKRCNPSYVDGEYWLYPAIYNHTRVKIYCYGLSSSQPKEYVTLHHLNKAITPNGRYYGSSSNCNIDEELGFRQGETAWNKIRLDITSGQVLEDHTFTIQTSGVPRDYGWAFSCSRIKEYLSCPKRGYGLVDVRDTGFQLSPSRTWSIYGWEAYCDIIERTTYRFEGRGDGNCGGCSPDGKLYLEVDSPTVPDLSAAVEPSCVFRMSSTGRE